jgi:hypothetical protein
MDEFLLSLRRLPMIILATLLVIPTGCLAPGEQMVNVSPETTASLASPTSAPVTAAPTLTTTQPPVVSSAEPPVEIATATPTADLPVAPVTGARAPDFTLTDLNGSEVSLSGLRGQPVLLNFWTTW